MHLPAFSAAPDHVAHTLLSRVRVLAVTMPGQPTSYVYSIALPNGHDLRVEIPADPRIELRAVHCRHDQDGGECLETQTSGLAADA